MTDPNQVLANFYPDEKASELGRAVDEAYFTFAEALPRRLRALAGRKGTFDHLAGSVEYKGISEVNALNVGTTWLFWELFHDLPEDQLTSLAAASVFLGLAYMMTDHLVDGQASDPGGAVLLCQAIRRQVAGHLRSLFPTADPFWQEYESLSSSLQEALAMEMDTREDPGLHSLETFRLTAQGKVSPAVITLTALAHLKPFPELSRAVAAVKDTISAGQLGHDVSDWSADLASGHLTYFLSRCAPPDAWRGSEWPAEEDVAAAINAAWLDVDHFKIARSWFEQAQEMGKPLGCAGWNTYIAHYAGLAEKSVMGATARHLKRILA